MRRNILLLGIVGILVMACTPSATEQPGQQGTGGGSLANNSGYYRKGMLAGDLREMPFHWPCQRATKGDRVEGSPATYVKGPMILVGCILDTKGSGIADTGTEVGAPSEATVTAGGFSTGKDGRYQEANIYVPGWYTVRVSTYGYKPVTKRVLIREGYTAVLDFVLQPQE